MSLDIPFYRTPPVTALIKHFERGLRLRPTYAAPTTAYSAAFAIAANKNMSHIVLGLLHTIGRKNSIGGQNGTDTPVKTAGPCSPIDNEAIVETEKPIAAKPKMICQSRVIGIAAMIPRESTDFT